jgi:hypothetical protein
MKMRRGLGGGEGEEKARESWTEKGVSRDTIEGAFAVKTTLTSGGGCRAAGAAGAANDDLKAGEPGRLGGPGLSTLDGIEGDTGEDIEARCCRWGGRADTGCAGCAGPGDMVREGSIIGLLGGGGGGMATFAGIGTRRVSIYSKCQ